MFNKKGLVSVTTFSFIVLLFISLVLTMYFFYSTSTQSFKEQIKQREILESVSKLKAELIVLSGDVNSTLNYTDEYALNQIEIELNSSNITATYSNNDFKVEETTNLYGLTFCSNATRLLISETIYYFNGSCISVS